MAITPKDNEFWAKVYPTTKKHKWMWQIRMNDRPDSEDTDSVIRRWSGVPYVGGAAWSQKRAEKKAAKTLAKVRRGVALKARPKSEIR